MAIVLALATVVATLLGGLMALRSRDHMHLVLGLSGGLLLGLVFFDLIPEVFELNDTHLLGVPMVMVLFVAGFLALHIGERASGAHEPAQSDYGNEHAHEHHHTAGLIGAIGMAVHVFLDGMAIAIGFQVSTKLGILVSLAVVSHAFTDGLNTVALLSRGSNLRQLAMRLLVIDGLARISGAAVGTFWVVPQSMLGIYLALFAGFLTYLATSHILPEAHSTHPSRATLGMTLVGIASMFAIVSLV